jgi:ribosomal protein L31E
LKKIPSDLQIHLQKLRRYITQTLPIRLLHFEPHNGKLKISLVEKAEVYNYFAPKLQADYYRHGMWLPYGWNEGCVRYAILSHTWNPTPGELTYGDWHNGSLDGTHPKCQKLVNFCKAAWKDHKLTLGWIDTVCINKESSAELDESIRSMYTWYSSARVCITYLAATNAVSNMHTDPWFTRGWTLQELVAPEVVKFYNMDWTKLSDATNDKNNSMIQKEIELATTITRTELNSFLWRRGRVSISRSMQLAAKRQVTREEDLAYCLMGIFRVSIATAYGEGGDRAFFRLVEEIFRSTKDVSDIFNWAGDHKHSAQQPTSLFPSHPSDYLNRQEFHPWRPIEPFTFTHLGLRTPVLLMCAVPIQGSVLQTVHLPIGDYRATVSVSPFPDRDGFAVAKSYHLLDKRFNGPEGLQKDAFRRMLQSKTWTLTFGILNVEEQGTSIHVPKSCLAILLQSTVELIFEGQAQAFSPGYSRVYTKIPIVFDLQKTRSNSDNKDTHYYELERSELPKHGMRLETLYL